MDTEKISIDLNNQELQQALQIIRFTHNSLFLTGKAGTGKSTFLRYIASTTKKKHVILAPTGIAAINAGGSTLHSFFKLPFYPLLPTDVRYSVRNIRKTLKYNSEKINIIKEVELIIIDEISMVRADIIDFIDKILRVYCHRMREPFGGKQMLFVGDVYQLEPVLKEDDRKLLHPFYPSGYFFDAHIFRAFQLVSIELKTVYRQTDHKFISLLDHIRTNTATDNDLHMLNTRVAAEQAMTNSDLSITLSTRRDTVDYINQQELEKLDGESFISVGKITGEFPESALPTPTELELKAGAHIMFIKNDMEKRWVNGTLGVISSIDMKGGVISVVTEDGEEHDVEKEFWENVRYKFNDTEKKIEEEQIGTFVQFPIRLAWAITVHKSQGLTFRNVKIDFTGGVFAGGQAYVALSRCTSLEGLALKEPLRQRDIFVREEVVRFSRHYNDNNIISTALKQSQADKEYADAVQDFDNGDFDEFLKNFFKAIHSRYDIENPVVMRYMRRKLNVINQLKQRNKELEQQHADQEQFLKKLSAEYVLMGKECERERMTTAAKSNYEKALELYPGNALAKKRLKTLKIEN